MRRFVAAVLALLVFAWASTAAAQTTRHQDLGRQFVETMLPADSYNQMLATMSGKFTQTFTRESNIPVEWAPLMEEAAREEMSAIKPLVLQIMGNGMARYFSEAELEFGIAFYRSSAGRKIMAASRANAKASLTAAEERELDRLYRSPAGRSFFAKGDTIEQAFESVETEFVRTLLPGLMRRFGEKAEAFEAARRAAS